MKQHNNPMMLHFFLHTASSSDTSILTHHGHTQKTIKKPNGGPRRLCSMLMILI